MIAINAAYMSRRSYLASGHQSSLRLDKKDVPGTFARSMTRGYRDFDVLSTTSAASVREAFRLSRSPLWTFGRFHVETPGSACASLGVLGS